MAKDKSRSLFWGKASRPSSISRYGAPLRSDGSDGDIEIRQTNTGTRIFAKLKGNWFSNLLFDSTLDSPQVFVPKAWVQDFDLVGDGAANILGKIPDFINTENIVSFTTNINLPDSSGNLFYSSGHQEYDAAEAAEAAVQAVFYLNLNTRTIYENDVGTIYQTSKVRVTIFYT